MSEKDVNDQSSSSRLFVFRGLVFGSLLLAAALCGTFAYLLLSTEESQNFQTQYDSLTDQILTTTHTRLNRARSAVDEVAVVHGIHDPKTSDWPKAYMEGYDSVYEHIARMANVIVVSVAPIVKPEEIPDFEDYVRSIYQSDPYNFQNPNLDLGVYGIGPNGMYHDTTGEVAFSQYNIITPLLNIGNISRYAGALMFNLHAEPIRAEAMDACYECSLKTKGSCVTLTDFLQLVVIEELLPNTLIFRAVYPLHDPQNLVGFQLVSLSWRDVLTGLIPDYVCGLDAVLSTDTQKYTYSLCHGKATLTCVGDCHESKFSSYRSLQALTLFDIETIQPSQYLLEVYPSQQLYDSYHSDTPWVSAVVVVLVILFTSLVFVSYDFFVAKESRERQQVLEAKRRFVRFVSHEIRTPLSTLVLGLKLLSDSVEVLPPELAAKNDLKQMTVELEGCSNVAVMVLNDLLQYDKIETGNLKLDLKEIRIWDLIKGHVHLFRSSAEEKRIRVSEEIIGNQDDVDDDSYLSLGVMGDELRIAQVIGNIMSNALKFSAEGSTIIVKRSYEKESPYQIQSLYGPKHRIKLQTTGNLGWILFSVKDTGPGISEENLTKLFGEGVQFNPNELQGGQGSGLGLWISKGIIELHGGHIWATSEGEGRGCTFFFQLPLIKLTIDISTQNGYFDNFSSRCRNLSVDVEAPSDIRIRRVSEELQPEDVELKEANDEGQKFILIVDDVPMLRKMLKRSLSVKGYDCVEAEDGRECVKMIQDGLSVACILMDFQMPFMNGPDATRELRKLGYKMPIIGVTGNVMPEDVAEFLNAGVNKVLGKPFQMDSFEEFMRDQTLYQTGNN